MSLQDDEATIIRKFKRAVTDSEACVRYAEDKPGVSNLMEIYSASTGRDFAAIEAEFAGRGYGDFKQAVGEAVAAELKPIQQRLAAYLSDKAQLEAMMKQGSERAQSVAARTLAKARKKMGFAVLK